MQYEVGDASITIFTQCVYLQQEREHFVWQVLRNSQVLRNFGAAPQRLTYRSAHGNSPGCLRGKATNQLS
jgi:hypothetical protein